MSNKHFSENEQLSLDDIIRHRRDIRGNNFLNTPIEQDIIDKILLSASLAPSVGYSQPWEFVLIEDEQTKALIVDSHKRENQRAAALYSDDKKSLYTQLKLEGIKESPINLAVFYKPSTQPVLGQHSMPEMGEYSVVCAIQNMWLTARSLNIGMGWVSILDADEVKTILNAPKENKLIAYLCLGYVKEFFEIPELEQLNWQSRKNLTIIKEKYSASQDENSYNHVTHNTIS